MSKQEKDVTKYIEELEDIPGTWVFTTKRARQGYWVNQFCMSLMKPENRKEFLSDEAASLKNWKMTPEQREAVIARDYNRLLDLGANIYYLGKVFATDGKSFVQGVSTMTGMSVDEYKEMMQSGGRSPIGNRSIKGKY